MGEKTGRLFPTFNEEFISRLLGSRLLVSRARAEADNGCETHAAAAFPLIPPPLSQLLQFCTLLPTEQQPYSSGLSGTGDVGGKQCGDLCGTLINGFRQIKVFYFHPFELL